jgi:hypothetical protein
MAGRSRKAWKRHERRTAERTNGDVTMRSGAFPQQKGDVRAALDGLLIECKWTTNKSYSVSVDTWRKIESEAHRMMSTPAMFLSLKDGAQRLDLVVMQMDDFLARKGGE